MIKTVQTQTNHLNQIGYGLQQSQCDPAPLLQQRRRLRLGGSCPSDQRGHEARLRAHVHRPARLGILRARSGFKYCPPPLLYHEPTRVLGDVHRHDCDGMDSSGTYAEDVNRRGDRMLHPFRRPDGYIARTDIPHLPSRYDCLHILHHGRYIRRDVGVRILHQDRSDQDGLVPLHGSYRPDYRFGG